MPGPFYFAWAGGAIEAQTTTVINGTTHGALLDTVGLVGDSGDANSAGRQLINLASTQGLEADNLYELQGPGIAAGTYFLFDDTILSGLPNSVNLSQAAGAHINASFVATRAVNVGVGLGTLTHGSSTITLADVNLPAGTYGIFGTGIGETDIPVITETGTTFTGGGGVMIIAAAFLVYNGAGTGQLAILAAQQHIRDGFDSFGQPTKITTYTVAQQPVRATASGQFALALSGFPTADRRLIDGIPASALTSLTPGLVYNISGNGIPVGATFVAPASGSTSLTLDQPATASDLNAILTINGPRTPDAPFNAAVHNRFDEDIVALEIAQEEGGLATLNMTIRNPKVGLLALGRNLWCWLSWDQNWPSGSPSLQPLFNGRLIGVPKLQADELVELQFLARPDDLTAQKFTLSESLKVLPYFDAVWLTLTPTPDTVLETYSSLYHVDRTSLQVTTSDILVGEAGTVAIGEDHAIYDRFSLSYGQPPLVATAVSGTVNWQQQAEGLLDVTGTIVSAFHAGGSGYSRPLYVGPFSTVFTSFPGSAWIVGGAGIIQCLCGDGLKSDWPKPGTSIGGGWSLSNLNDSQGSPLCYILDASMTAQGGWLTPATYDVNYTAAAPTDTAPTNVGLVTSTLSSYAVSFPLSAFKIRMHLEYRADRRRTETITAVIAAGVQRELSDSSESDRETISLTSEYVSQGIDPDGALPIGNLSYRSYFQTDRGARSFEYLLLAARAKMRARARAVDIAFAVNWATAVPITLRHSVTLTDRRLPGGTATGKVKSYRLSVRGGVMLGEFTIGCAIGTGSVETPQAGTLSYVNAGYVNPGYQIVTGMQEPLITGEIAYQTLDNFVVADDGLDLTHLTESMAVNECVVTNGLKTQMTRLNAFQGAVATTYGDPLSTMKTMTTTVTLDLKPVAGAEFHTDFFPAVTALTLPKTIDLSAAAGATLWDVNATSWDGATTGWDLPP
jgi:hypothetical protein